MPYAIMRFAKRKGGPASALEKHHERQKENYASNPHMHLCFVPLTADKRLSAKEIIGNRDKLVQWQDNFHDYMSEEFPELGRGQAAAVTKRKHVPTWMYKQAHRLTDEMELIRSEIKNVGTLNAGKQREKVLKLLSKWYPQVNAFEAKLKPYDQEIQSLRQRVREESGDAEWAQVALQYEREQSRDKKFADCRSCFFS